jgi:stage II sporulation protein D
LRLARIIFVLAAFTPGIARAQDVRLRLYSLHAPTEINLTATVGTLHWRICAGCPDNLTSSLYLNAFGEVLHLGGAGSTPEIFISGAYRIDSTGLPSIAASFPIEIQARENHLFVIAAIPIEEYVTAVLAGESGDFNNDEAMRAMAVAVRTYSTRFRGHHGKDGFDFCDTTHCQVPHWKNIPARVRAAVKATQGEVLWFSGAPIETYYHQNCGGMVAASSEVWPTVRESYLRGHPDPFCLAASQLKWETSIPVEDLDGALRDSGIDPPGHWTGLAIVSRSASGRAKRLRLEGGKSPVTVISASTFRYAVDRALGWNKIRSDLYDIRNSGDHVLFSGRGAGHGVGLCQAGAEEMGREGKTYREILSFYYPGTQLNKPEQTKWQKRTTERFQLISTAPEEDTALLPIAGKILKEDESAVGWKLSSRVSLQVFPTLNLFRDTTGQPGWVAAVTRGPTVRLQPFAELKKKSIVESTLRHEFFHLLVESHIHADIPLWFREGLVLYLAEPRAANPATQTMTDEQMEAVLRQPSDHEDVKRAYASSRARVAALAKQNGKQTILDWLRSGIPASALPQSATAPDQGTSEHPRK